MVIVEFSGTKSPHKDAIRTALSGLGVEGDDRRVHIYVSVDSSGKHKVDEASVGALDLLPVGADGALSHGDRKDYELSRALMREAQALVDGVVSSAR